MCHFSLLLINCPHRCFCSLRLRELKERSFTNLNTHKIVSFSSTHLVCKYIFVLIYGINKSSFPVSSMATVTHPPKSHRRQVYSCKVEDMFLQINSNHPIFEKKSVKNKISSFIWCVSNNLLPLFDIFVIIVNSPAKH